ncbi:MAG: hypothetical protein IJ794_13920 [Lachnospiraceae bacterium]|nr:hypothetical protein [Lachnospiraceae bacterium]
MKKYELWIDESGSFSAEDQQDPERIPSLVGGILIEQDVISDDELTQMTSVSGSEGFAHSTDYGQTQEEQVVIPALESIFNRGGRLVYFENSERISDLGHRELYLRLLALGLVQLIRTIGKNGAFLLDIYIALRVDRDRGYEKIPDEEYIRMLKGYMKESREYGMLEFEPGSKVNLSILSARKERKLQLADFACNARLTRNSHKFDGQEVRERLYRLFDEDYIFSFKIHTSENRILSMLAAEKIADALMELYTGYGDLDPQEMLAEIMDRFAMLSYRLQRLQLKRFTANVVSFIRAETDFERSEAIAKKILGELFAEIENRKIQVQTDEAQFELNAWLLDMYLREGDIIKAGQVLEQMQKIISGMNYRVENLAHLYLYIDRKALYEINCMEYAKAVRTMEKSIHAMENIIEILDVDEGIGAFFQGHGKMASEYLGDAYCMKIYAEMFLQREDEGLYERCLRQDTEIALAQYEYEGELERNRQYRAHIEMIRGNYRDAFTWLLMAAECGGSEEDLPAACGAYLQKAQTEDPLSRAYYLMYYVELLQEAYSGGDTRLAQNMEEALTAQEEIWEEYFQEGGLSSEIRSDVEGQEPEIHLDLFKNLLGSPTRVYHPWEILLWKYGVYQYQTGCDLKEADGYLERAVEICDRDKDYTMMDIIALAILLDQLAFRMEKGQKSISECGAERLRRRAGKVLQTEGLPEKLFAYAQQVKDFIDRVKAKSSCGAEEAKEARKLAEKIAY